MKTRTEVQALADQLQGYISAIGDLAVAVREDLAFEGSRDEAPRLSGDQVDAIHFSIITIAKLAGEDLITLLDKLEVPA
ncbi:hypothetical protein [Pseudomonas sp. NBRC 111135]|uniref:hypothetical protein n=1 Tax=Pseudomonas sp. NBRC 111135 TaxID=1661050 RepID=UPI0006D4682D|nr:hypothetical protein [Pseudomonas sp. NBRC 111135]